jgi:hypothetical protein
MDKTLTPQQQEANIKLVLKEINKIVGRHYNRQSPAEDEKTYEEEVKELFTMVYQWGRVGIVTDEHSPAFREQLREVMKKYVR